MAKITTSREVYIKLFKWIANVDTTQYKTVKEFIPIVSQAAGHLVSDSTVRSLLKDSEKTLYVKPEIPQEAAAILAKVIRSLYEDLGKEIPEELKPLLA
jgi:hypothetical protein